MSAEGKPKRNLDKVNIPMTLNAEGKKVDLTAFNS
jgi:hypothetical protein